MDLSEASHLDMADELARRGCSVLLVVDRVTKTDAECREQRVTYRGHYVACLGMATLAMHEFTHDRGEWRDEA